MNYIPPIEPDKEIVRVSSLELAANLTSAKKPGWYYIENGNYIGPFDTEWEAENASFI